MRHHAAGRCQQHTGPGVRAAIAQRVGDHVAPDHVVVRAAGYGQSRGLAAFQRVVLDQVIVRAVPEFDVLPVVREQRRPAMLRVVHVVAAYDCIDALDIDQACRRVHETGEGNLVAREIDRLHIAGGEAGQLHGVPVNVGNEILRDVGGAIGLQRHVSARRESGIAAIRPRT